MIVRDTFRRQVTAAQRKADGERRTFSETAVDCNRATVQPHQFIDQRQADTGTLVGASRRAFHAVEAFEDAWQLRFRNA